MDVRNTNNSSIEEAKKRVMVLPFQPLSFAFNHILMYTKQLCLFTTSIQLTHYFNTFSSLNVGREKKTIEWSISIKNTMVCSSVPQTTKLQQFHNHKVSTIRQNHQIIECIHKIFKSQNIFSPQNIIKLICNACP